MRGAFAVAMAAACVGCGRTTIGFGADEAPACDGGDAGFATRVLGYDPTAGGGARPARDDAADPETALGPPDARHTPPLGAVSIGEGGTLTLGFDPCVMGTDGTDAPDLVVHEHGYEELVDVALRPSAAARPWFGSLLDDDGFLDLELRVDSGGTLDVDVPLGELPDAAKRFDAVRLRDVAEQGERTEETPGADIDAVEIMVVLPGDNG